MTYQDPITVTDALKTYLIDSIESSSQPESMARLSISTGGCAEFEYVWTMDVVQYYIDIAIMLDESHKLLIDQDSLRYLLGSTIDYVSSDPFNKRIEITNPLAIAGCGCGTSFTTEN